MGKYEDRHLRDCLINQARLCERIAASTWDDEAASHLEKLAQDCRTDAKPIVKKAGRPKSPYRDGAADFETKEMAPENAKSN